jgi:hypothetical protein
VQQLEIAAVVALIMGVIVVATSARARRTGGIDQTSTRLVIGSVVGLIGAAVVLAPRLDIVPDTWQTMSEVILIGAVTLVVILVSVYRKTR